jgi:hypothetical protein
VNVYTGSRRTTHAWYIQDSFKAACVCSARLRNLFMTCTCTLNAKSAANQRSPIFPNASSRKPSLQHCVHRCKNLHTAFAFASAEWTNFQTRAEFTHVSVIVGKVSDIGLKSPRPGWLIPPKASLPSETKSGSVHPDAFACTTTNKKFLPPRICPYLCTWLPASALLFDLSFVRRRSCVLLAILSRNTGGNASPAFIALPKCLVYASVVNSCTPHV